MSGITKCLSIFTLNVTGLKSPSKDNDWHTGLKKEDPISCCLQETHSIDRKKHCLRVEGWKKI
jgi:hypothetical protein